MIGRVSGILLEVKPPELLVDVHGVGYEINAPLSTIFSLPHKGEPVQLLTHLAVREDAHVLYGFGTEQERVLFRALIRINGVGPKLALGILSGMETRSFIEAIRAQDASMLVKIPGVGKKTAERLIIEMKDRLDALGSEGAAIMARPEAELEIAPDDSPIQDAESALIALGYKPAQASKAVNAVFENGMSSAETIRAALKQL